MGFNPAFKGLTELRNFTTLITTHNLFQELKVSGASVAVLS